MKSLAVLFVISLLFLAGGCSENYTPLSPVDDNVTLTKVPVPFKVSIQGYNTVIPNAPYTGSTVFEISGNGTHIGKYSAYGSNDYAVTGLTTGVGYNGVLNMISANGDEMHFTYTASWIINSEGLYEYTFNLEVTGGTGRFDGATGEITSMVIGTNVEPGNPLYKSLNGEGNGWIMFQ
jgi:hypothetical protein